MNCYVYGSNQSWPISSKTLLLDPCEGTEQNCRNYDHDSLSSTLYLNLASLTTIFRRFRDRNWGKNRMCALGFKQQNLQHKGNENATGKFHFPAPCSFLVSSCLQEDLRDVLATTGSVGGMGMEWLFSALVLP
jgi:hypothetical protein